MRISPAISVVLWGFVLLPRPTAAEGKPKGYLGAYVRDVAEEEIVAEGLGQKARCLGVVGTAGGSPADGLLRRGDLILTALLVDSLQSVGDFGQQRHDFPESNVSKGFAASQVLSAIELVESLNRDLMRACRRQAGNLDDLNKISSHVSLWKEATRGSILAILDNILDRSQQEDLSDDLLFFYFSGHGLIDPDNRTILASPATTDYCSKKNLEKTGLTSDMLVRHLLQFPGRKVVILDACRTGAEHDTIEPMDPGLTSQEFEAEALQADVFSGVPGQPSIEGPEFAYETNARAKSDQGNSLYAYALLKALSEPMHGTSGELRDAIDTPNYWFTRFFDVRDEKSYASTFRARA
jgi:hypothetical protein